MGETAIFAELEALDGLLGRAITAANAAFGVAPGEGAHRGLHISASDVDDLLERPPGEGMLATGGTLTLDGPAWARLRDAFALSEFELKVALIALAPEVDLRYERIYAYLQDDVTRRRPSVELCLNLLCASRAEKLERLNDFLAGAPLVRSGLASLVADPQLLEPPLAARCVVLDERLVAFLLGGREADPRLGACAKLVERPDPFASPEPLVDALVRLAGEEDGRSALSVREPSQGRAGAVAAALAGRFGVPLLVIDAERMLDADPQLVRLPALACREAVLSGAVMYLEHADSVVGEGREAVARRLRDALAACRAVVVLAGDEATEAAILPDALAVELPEPTVEANREAWSGALAAAGVTAPTRGLDDLALRFRLTPPQMRMAARSAARRARLDGVEPQRGALLTAAREASSSDVGVRARKLRTTRHWDELVLPDDRKQALRDLTNAIRDRAVVFGDWGFGAKLTLGRGLSVLFAGPSGTGKTMAAQVIATELALDLYRIDLSAVVSKYIGETEKNLAQVFAAGEAGSGILFFDEADALFGRRSEVRDAHDRYANIEVGYLLQRMEEYDGVAILATNLRRNMEEAFVRRMQFTIDFPVPDAGDRRRIWETIWPNEVPRASDVDFELLAGRFELSGGNIRNVALGAAFLAAADGRVVTMDHVLRATRRELQKIGTLLSPADMDGRS